MLSPVFSSSYGNTHVSELEGAEGTDIFGEIVYRIFFIGGDAQDRSSRIIRLYKGASNDERAVLDSLLSAITGRSMSQIRREAVAGKR